MTCCRDLKLDNTLLDGRKPACIKVWQMPSARCRCCQLLLHDFSACHVLQQMYPMTSPCDTLCADL